jgi:hypothetical protein
MTSKQTDLIGWPRSIMLANCIILVNTAFCTNSNAAAITVQARRINLTLTGKKTVRRGTTPQDTSAQPASAA